MALQAISEIIIYVQDMARQVEFYSEYLGLSVKFPNDCKDYSKEFWVTFDTGACTLALHGGGSRRFGEDAPKFVFEVKDIENAHAQLLAKGVSLEKIFQAAPGVRVANGTDPEGNKFSIEEHS